MTGDEVIEGIEQAFAAVQRPGAPFLVDSREGCEPGEVAATFAGRKWQDLEPPFLDANYTALSFFSEGAFRYFLPAYLVADVRRALQTADPVFHLTHGFHDGRTRVQAGGEWFDRRFGGSSLVNPRRYGAITTRDYARMRLSVFTREEASAIVAYLEYRRAAGEQYDRPPIDAALDGFWRERAASAPTAAALESHLAEDARYVAALQRGR
jgi:hypothetical protein